MLERAREVTRNGKYTYIEYARFADDLVILIDAYKRHDWLVGAVDKRLWEEFGKLQVGDLGRLLHLVAFSIWPCPSMCPGRRY